MKRLIVAPHIDDDVIGCGGIMSQGDYVLYIGVDDFHVISAEGRIDEAEATMRIAGTKRLGPPYKSFVVNRYRESFVKLIGYLEDTLASIEPDEVLLPWPSYNQDHQAVYDAAMVALRPHDKNPMISRVLLYEEPDCYFSGIGRQFEPTLFREIDIEKKLELVKAMPSQLRGHRSLHHIRALATVRGAAIMRPYAEAFHVVRYVDWYLNPKWPATGVHDD